MTDALMVAVAAGVAAWVLAPLYASVRNAAADGRRTRPYPDSDRFAAQAGDAPIAPQREAGDRGAPPGVPGDEGGFGSRGSS